MAERYAWHPPSAVTRLERVQSIAFGDLKGRPQVVARWNPLDREAAYLEPFAAARSSYLTTAVQEERLPRIWLPHHAALEVVALLGNRYRANKYASPLLQTMGWLCHALVEEAAVLV